MNLERRVARLSLRAWGLILNLLGNALLLHGAIRYLSDGADAYEMIAGIVITATCIAVLSIPSG